MELTLDRVRPGHRAVITKLCVRTVLCSRLRDFGVIPGTVVGCCYRSPEGRVTALEVRGTVIAMRTRDLQKIRVTC